MVLLVVETVAAAVATIIADVAVSCCTRYADPSTTLAQVPSHRRCRRQIKRRRLHCSSDESGVPPASLLIGVVLVPRRLLALSCSRCAAV
jgi:hypothetical protein